MKHVLTPILASFLVAAPNFGAMAAATDWVEEEGARIRFVAAEPAAGDTEIRAALEIELKEGWKTYWRDPGDAGVPPQISVTGNGVSGSELHYPAPERFDDGKSVWAGYKHTVAFPITVKLAADMPETALKLRSFLGICEDICIPVQSEFPLIVPQANASTEDQALVSAFFEALPAAANPEFAISGLRRAVESVEIGLASPADAGEVELFLAADGYMFGQPHKIRGAEGSARYSARIIFAPKQAVETEVFYTVKSSKGAVSGTVMLPAK